MFLKKSFTYYKLLGLTIKLKKKSICLLNTFQFMVIRLCFYYLILRNTLNFEKNKLMRNINIINVEKPFL